jgi:hypothetical protein
MKNKKGLIGGTMILFVIILLLAFMGFLLFVTIKNIQVRNNDCLKEIAINYCEEQGMFYDKLWYDFTNSKFSCLERERGINSLLFKFTKEEVEECLG